MSISESVCAHVFWYVQLSACSLRIIPDAGIEILVSLLRGVFQKSWNDIWQTCYLCAKSSISVTVAYLGLMFLTKP